MKRILNIARRCIRYGEKRLNMLGKRHECYICKRKFNHFYPFRGGTASTPPFVRELAQIGSDIDNFSCPVCHSNDRERHLFMFFDKLRLWNIFHNATVLHFAPERNLTRAIKDLGPKEYVQADLFPKTDGVRKVDVTNIELPNNYFDFIICNHVLEHVPDDKKGMLELYRVLGKGKQAILQTPFSSVLANSFSDPNINTDELRLKYYGQEDHVRVYGYDLFTKLERVGFHLELRKHNDYFTPEASAYYGVNPKEDLILVSKR